MKVIVNTKIKKICQHCGKEFFVPAYRERMGNVKFCSYKCKYDSGRVTYKCLICGKEKTVRKGHYKYANFKYCSQKCHGISRRDMGSYNSLPKVTGNCVVCGKEWKANQWNARGKKYCSKKCMYIGAAKTRKEANINRKKDVEKITQDHIRKCEKYQSWRQSCYIRDNFTCQKCGDNKGGNLVVHHKVRFMVLVKQAIAYMPLLSQFDAVMLFAPMWDISNGVTLCEKCHKEIHRKR